MPNEPALALLKAWQNYYMILGTAAATLAGLMSVATSLVAEVERRRAALDAGIAAFNTPTIVHFGAVLLGAAVMAAPWSALSSLRLVLGPLGLAAVAYMLIVLRRMRRVPQYETPLKDWLWYLGLPLASYLAVTLAAASLPAYPGPALYVIAAAMVVLLLSGIHNAWDLVTYFAVESAQTDTRKTQKRSQ